MRQFLQNVLFVFGEKREKRFWIFIAIFGFLSFIILSENVPHFAIYTAPDNHQWKDKNLYNMSFEETQEFFTYKEDQYAKCRNQVAKECELLDPTSESFILLPTALSYDAADKVAFCQIAKVASSTWSFHFITLANATESIHLWRYALQNLSPTLWPLPEGTTSDQLSSLIPIDDFTSIVVVRHPFSRLVSVYHQKIIDSGIGSGWEDFNRGLMNRYRTETRKAEGLEEMAQNMTFHFPGDDPRYPSPEEFVLFIIDDASQRNSKIEMNHHWRPQYASCPFCRLNFTIYARVEDMYEDTAYFFIRSNLIDRVSDVGDHHNPSMSGGDRKETEFWSRVEMKYVHQVFQVYALDFEMFDYSVGDYFEAIDLKEKLNDPVSNDSMAII